ncbi:FAD binding domain protein [Aulographum hederae CBS 113979]|uniref:FAD binding domain protein n=1 Tax=Aulographum hederae CBS 113979 TaxID=1176131 RepID=A0A6G1GTF6_9PEZI|nr:FAD binding domain protein [Aulographum hederae CBS 113979]
MTRAMNTGGVSSGQNGHDTALLEFDTLIIGTGPAGASLACFLASHHGITGLMVSSNSGSTDTPRAHITNMAAMECLRDIGLDKELDQLATKGDCMTHTRWCHSMAGEEYARIYSWGNDPMRKGDYHRASPCNHSDLPQTQLEPALVRHAILKGFLCRWNTNFISFEEGPQSDTVITTLQDTLTKTTYRVRSKYLFGADGARSNVIRQLQLPLLKVPNDGLAINVLVKADLSQLVANRTGNLHWVMQPDRESPDFGWMALVRMVKPWYEWMFIMFPRSGTDVSQVSREQWLQRVRELIGDDSISAEILDISNWKINEIVAEEYSRGRIFCLGDAVHRHPPFNGLGSNTCIQDSFNLAWKIAYVLRRKAHPNLLSTYSTERQPVGYSVIKRANDGFREHSAVWENLGILPQDLASRKAVLDELSASTPAGRARRKAFQEAIRQTCHEFHGLGIEMGQLYTGLGIDAQDEKEPYQCVDRVAADPILYYEPSTYPGCRLPHAWLNKAVPQIPVSTIDLAGKGGFTLFTGIGGEDWITAARKPGLLAIPIRAYSIGFRQDWEDVYFDWEEVRGVEESGAVLVRPDNFVVWRGQESLGSVEKCARKLNEVLRAVLGFLDESMIYKTALGKRRNDH